MAAFPWNKSTTSCVWQLPATATQPVLPRKGRSTGIRQGHRSGTCLGASLLEQTLSKQLWHPARKREISVKLCSALLAWPGPPQQRWVSQALSQHGRGAQGSRGDAHLLFSSAAPLNCWLQVTLKEAPFPLYFQCFTLLLY